MLIRGVVAAVRVAKFTPKALLWYSFCIHNTLFPLHFHFYALLKLQLNCEISILPFPDRNNFRFKVSISFKFQNAIKIIQFVHLGRLLPSVKTVLLHLF